MRSHTALPRSTASAPPSQKSGWASTISNARRDIGPSFVGVYPRRGERAVGETAPPVGAALARRDRGAPRVGIGDELAVIEHRLVEPLASRAVERAVAD